MRAQEIQVVARTAARDESALIQSMLPAYLHDLNASSDYPYLPLYWSEPGRYPYLLFLGESPAGFALVRKIAASDGFMSELAEFYVKPEYRGQGVGAQAARNILRLHPGRWTLATLPDNDRAYRFWTHLLYSIAGRALVERPGPYGGRQFEFTVTLKDAAPQEA